MDFLLLLKFFSAFVLVIALMLLFSWILKRTGVASSITPAGSKRRLKIVEFMALDHRRRLVLVRHDDKEHLLLLSSGGETVVEAAIPVDISRDGQNVQN